jgi:hypothetical protein
LEHQRKEQEKLMKKMQAERKKQEALYLKEQRQVRKVSSYARL